MASRKALIVAINDYPESANDLPSCVEDAKGITALLQSDPYAFVDEKVLRMLPAILPGILQAYRSKGVQASGPGVATSQAPEEDEKFWGQVVAAAITAAPGIYQAVRGKDFELGD